MRKLRNTVAVARAATVFTSARASKQLTAWLAPKQTPAAHPQTNFKQMFVAAPAALARAAKRPAAWRARKPSQAMRSRVSLAPARRRAAAPRPHA